MSDTTQDVPDAQYPPEDVPLEYAKAHAHSAAEQHHEDGDLEVNPDALRPDDEED